MTPNPPAPNRQGELFADPREPRPAANWSRTSRAAAHAIRESAPNLRARVLEFIAARGPQGATNDEIAAGLGMLLQSVCARANELWARKQIRDSGRTRLSRTGRPAKVWEAC